jgi:RNA polymerase sigma-70 factor (ECF subfamily)
LHRDLIRRAHFGGRTTQEIAADLDLPEPVVKCELHRALHIMRRLVASGYDAERQ